MWLRTTLKPEMNRNTLLSSGKPFSFIPPNKTSTKSPPRTFHQRIRRHIRIDRLGNSVCSACSTSATETYGTTSSIDNPSHALCCQEGSPQKTLIVQLWYFEMAVGSFGYLTQALGVLHRLETITFKITLKGWLIIRAATPGKWQALLSITIRLLWPFLGFNGWSDRQRICRWRNTF